MFWDDLKKVLSGPVLYRLDEVLGARLAPLLYALGLAALALWAIDHFVSSFALSFTQGLWSLLEIAVYGSFGVIALRIVCEAVLVLFDANTPPSGSAGRGKWSRNLLDEVGDAIHELADDDDGDGITPATDPTPFILADDIDPPIAPNAGQSGGRRPRR